MSDYPTSARAALAVAFPPALGMKGALTTLADLCRPAYRQPGRVSTYIAALYCIARNQEHAESYGHGNAAKRRHRAIIAENQGRSDRQQNVAAVASARFDLANMRPISYAENDRRAAAEYAAGTRTEPLTAGF